MLGFHWCFDQGVYEFSPFWRRSSNVGVFTHFIGCSCLFVKKGCMHACSYNSKEKKAWEEPFLERSEPACSRNRKTPAKNSWILSPCGGFVLVGLTTPNLWWGNVGGLVVEGSPEEELLTRKSGKRQANPWIVYCKTNITLWLRASSWSLRNIMYNHHQRVVLHEPGVFFNAASTRHFVLHFAFSLPLSRVHPGATCIHSFFEKMSEVTSFGNWKWAQWFRMWEYTLRNNYHSWTTLFCGMDLAMGGVE